MKEIDVVRDYDFDRLSEYEEKYCGIDRKRALAGIFYKVCDGELSDTERHKKIWAFCSKVSYHSYLQPVAEDGQALYDPILLLELHEMKCGQVARLGCDLLSAVGYKTRLVQLGGHVIAEVYYDSSWHYIDADLWNGYKAVEKDGGRLCQLKNCHWILI